MRAHLLYAASLAAAMVSGDLVLAQAHAEGLGVPHGRGGEITGGGAPNLPPGPFSGFDRDGLWAAPEKGTARRKFGSRRTQASRPCGTSRHAGARTREGTKIRGCRGQAAKASPGAEARAGGHAQANARYVVCAPEQRRRPRGRAAYRRIHRARLAAIGFGHRKSAHATGNGFRAGAAISAGAFAFRQTCRVGARLGRSLESAGDNTVSHWRHGWRDGRHQPGHRNWNPAILARSRAWA